MVFSLDKKRICSDDAKIIHKTRLPLLFYASLSGARIKIANAGMRDQHLMKKVLLKVVQLGFLFGLIIIAVSALLPYHNVQLLQRSERWVDHTMAVLQAADTLRIAVTDAESGQRGFLLTQDAAYLEPYNSARQNITHQLDLLISLAADNPAQLQKLEKIKTLIELKFNELQATVDLQNESKHIEALNLVATGRGNDLMQQIRTQLSEFEATERVLLSDRASIAREHFQNTFYSFALLTTLNFLLFASLYFFIVRYFRMKQAAELSLKHQSNLLTSIINSMSEGLSVIDADGKTLFHNPVLLEIYGKDAAGFNVEDWQSQFHISAMDGAAFNYADFPAVKVLNGAREATADMIIRQAGVSKPKIIRVTARPMIVEEGAIQTVVCISSDITHHKQAELRLRFATQQAESANKAKSEFVANMSHEIRTPLNAILGMAQLLHKTELAKDQQKYLDMITLAGKSLLNILNDILDFSKIEAGKMDITPVQFRLHDVMQSIGVVMSMAAMEKNIELVVDIEPEVPPIIIGDAHRLHQILVNLVGNAIKFTDQGEVCVHAGCQHLDDDRITIRFSVKDTGIGMTQAQQDRLFTPFTQADTSITRQYGGTGLGLIISRRIAQMMGGEIEVESYLGKGSEFSLTIPFGRCDDIERRDFPRHSLGSLQLLVIDKNESSRNAIANHIALWQWKTDFVIPKENETEFLDKVNQDNKKYDAIIINWQSSWPDTALKKVRSLFSAAPIILMVNMYTRDSMAGQELSNGVVNSVHSLLKPVIASNLFDAINEALGNSLTDENSIQKHGLHTQPLEDIRLLLVEDNEFNQIVARDLLQQAGAVVDVVENGQHAIDVLRINAKSYDAILMDVQMPVMDGFTATKIIRQDLKINIPIIAMTAGVTAFERESCIASGMNDLIAKPVETEKMLATILQYIPRAQPVSVKVAGDNSVLPEKNGVFDVTSLLKIGTNVPGYLLKAVVLIENLVNNSEASLQKAKTALASGEYEEVAKIFHTLRGTLGVVGAIKFSEYALALEKRIKEGAFPETLKSSFDDAAIELQKTLAAGRSWLAENSDSLV